MSATNFQGQNVMARAICTNEAPVMGGAKMVYPQLLLETADAGTGRM